MGSKGMRKSREVLRTSLWSGINMQTGAQEWRAEPADGWADSKAHEHSTVVLMKPWSHHFCMLFRSYEVNIAVWEAWVQTLPLPSPALWTVPYTSDRAKETSHRSVDAKRSRMWALSAGAGCPKVPREQHCPYPLTLAMEKIKKGI